MKTKVSESLLFLWECLKSPNQMATLLLTFAHANFDTAKLCRHFLLNLRRHICLDLILEIVNFQIETTASFSKRLEDSQIVTK